MHKRHNLVFPMISGRRTGAADADGELRAAPFWRFALGAVMVSGLVWMVTTGFYF